MDIFKIPVWESSTVGDERAKELLKKNVKRKALNRQKSKKRKATSFEDKRLIKKERVNKTQERKIKNIASSTFNTPNRLNKWQIKSKRITNVEKVSKIKKNNTQENNSDKIIQLNKKKMAKLKKRNKQIENLRTKENSVKLKSTNAILNTDTKKISNTNLKQKYDNNINNNRKQCKKIKLINMLNKNPTVSHTKTIKTTKPLSLKEKMLEQLKASRFRYINEQLYNAEGKEAQKFFSNDPDSFFAYHNGYRQQIMKWPLNPLDNIIKSIKKMPGDYIIADFGCGDANLAKSVSQKVHSFDFVAINDYVTPCDMAHVPLENESVNIVVFCLSLMGTNIREYLFEANRILKKGGKLKIAEVESRFDTVDIFIEGAKRFGFNLKWKDLSHNLFYFLDFEKISKCKPLNKLPTVSLHPCLYKKR